MPAGAFAPSCEQAARKSAAQSAAQDADRRDGRKDWLDGNGMASIIFRWGCGRRSWQSEGYANRLRPLARGVAQCLEAAHLALPLGGQGVFDKHNEFFGRMKSLAK
jgi:hypothetical protein